MRRLTIFLLLGLFGCGKGHHEDPILRLSADEALQIGKELLAAEKYTKAQRHLEHAFEVEPNSRSGREALLLAGDALYLKGGFDDYLKCETKYRDFLNRFPTSERADYAQFQVGNCLSARIEKPDRDQQVTQQALDAYEELLRLYPTSPYVDKTQEKIVEVRDRLAMHELVVARFYDRYSRRGFCRAAIGRLKGLDDEYPRFSALDEALFRLWAAYRSCDEADKAAPIRAKLEELFPQSGWIAELDPKEREILKDLEKLRRNGRQVRPAAKAQEKEDDAGSADEEPDDGGSAEGGAR